MTTSQWPYPSFRDPDWLGGSASGDPARVAVIRVLRGLLSDGGGVSGDPAETLLLVLARAAELSERVDWAKLSLVGELRALGVPWATVGAALGVTKQAAQHRFAPVLAEALDQAAREDSGG